MWARRRIVVVGSAVAEFPRELAAEWVTAPSRLDAAPTRQVKATLCQSLGGLAGQQRVRSRDFEPHKAPFDAPVGKVRGVVDRAEEAGRAMDAEALRPLEVTEGGAKRTTGVAAAAIVDTLPSLLLCRIGPKRWVSAVLAAWLMVLGGPGCVAASRTAVTDQQLRDRRVAADEQFRESTDEFVGNVLDRAKSEYDDFNAGRAAAPPVIDVLILSGGGDWGAFAAGFLKGWGEMPPDAELARPEFDVVTGVSTGSLIAPFAFLGDRASIETIVGLYRNPKKGWVRKRGPLYFLPHYISFARIHGLEREVRATVDADLVRRIADAGASGRVLAVNTTNVDDGVPRVFDVVAEARRATDPSNPNQKQDLKRVHDVLLASSGIPGAFPFRVIDDELYVDGGVTGNIIYGGRISEEDGLGAQWQARCPEFPVPKIRYWVIFNNWVRPHPVHTPPNWPAVVTRSLELGTRAATLTSLRHLHAMAEIARVKHDADVEVRVVSVPEDWSPPKPGAFVKETMNELADLGERLGSNPSSWSTTPP